MAGTINVPAVRPPEHDNTGLQLLAGLLKTHLENKEKLATDAAESDRAYEATNSIFNPPREVETASPAQVEAQNAQAKIAAQPTPNPLADLVMPKQSTVPDNLVETAPVEPVGTPATAKMPAAQTAVMPPQPGDEDYVNIPKGLKASDYGMMARNKITPTTDKVGAAMLADGDYEGYAAFMKARQAAKPTAIQMVKNSTGNYVGIEKKLGDSGVQGQVAMNPYRTFVEGQLEQNPGISKFDLDKAWDAKRLKEIQARIPSAQATGFPGIYFDRRDKAYYDMENRRVTDPNTLINLSAMKRQADAEAAQRGGPRAMAINAANDLYQENLPEVVALRWKVANKNLFSHEQMDTLSKFENIKDWNAAKQWLNTQTGDPDTAVLIGKVVLMADNLQKTIGGNQGGEWAFKTAKALLDPTLGPEAFEARMWSHSDDLYNLARSWREGGTHPASRADQDYRPGGAKAADIRTGETPKADNAKGFPTPPAKSGVAAAAPAAPPAKRLPGETIADYLKRTSGGR